MQDRLETIERQIMDRATELFGDKLESVLLYGSYARGDYDDESDIDILLLANVTQEEAHDLEMALIPFASRLGLDNDILVSLYVKDRDTFYKWLAVLPYYQNILREGVSLLA
jgi:predicted nucleotidyltransferase